MNKDIYEKQILSISGKEITIYPSPLCDSPVVYLNTYTKDDDQIYKSLCDINCNKFNLVTIRGLRWEHDMAPWDIPPISREDTPCTGGADEYLQFLIYKIIPKAEENLQGCAAWRGLAGYSLAGLFALYSLYNTEIFSRIASISGSLWFPGFKDYVFSHEMKNLPKRLYMSLGDKECKTRNSYLRIVKANTEELYSFYMKKSIDTKLQINQGGHYKDAVQRIVSGVEWILKN